MQWVYLDCTHGMVSVQKPWWPDLPECERGAAQFLKHRPHLESGIRLSLRINTGDTSLARPTRGLLDRRDLRRVLRMHVRGGGFKPKDCEVRQKQNRRLWEREYRNKTHIRASLTDAYRSLSARDCVSTAHM